MELSGRLRVEKLVEDTVAVAGRTDWTFLIFEVEAVLTDLLLRRDGSQGRIVSAETREHSLLFAKCPTFSS